MWSRSRDTEPDNHCTFLVSLLHYLFSIFPQDEGLGGDMSDWDRYASDQYEILLAEEAYEQENEYVQTLRLFLLLGSCMSTVRASDFWDMLVFGIGRNS